MAIDTTQAVRIKTIVTQDGVLHLEGPFQAGDAVEVIVLREATEHQATERYPLRGTPVRYLDPFEPVDAGEWDATA